MGEATTVASEPAEVYLVLGGNGFIGSHIVDYLCKQGKRVKVLDPFRHDPQFSNPEAVEKMVGSAFVSIDLDKALKGVTHLIYSLAATNPFTADTDPYADIDNLKRGVEILEACVRANVKKIGFISSGGAVYGRLAEKKVADEQDLPAPVSPYGICKLAMEHYMEYFKKKYGLDYVVYRLSNPYGPRQVFKKGQGVITAFMQQIADQEKITIFGDGSASRDFIYIEDAARMIAETLPLTNQHAVYNIGSGHQITLNDIITNLERLLEKEASVVFVEAPKTTLQKTSISIDRFKKEFDAGIISPFEEGLAKTVEYFKTTYAID